MLAFAIGIFCCIYIRRRFGVFTGVLLLLCSVEQAVAEAGSSLLAGEGPFLGLGHGIAIERGPCVCLALHF